MTRILPYHSPFGQVVSDPWHGINDAIAKASLLGGGEAVYVVDKGKGVEWRFGSRARP